jgi:hypothetical protein
MSPTRGLACGLVYSLVFAGDLIAAPEPTPPSTTEAKPTITIDLSTPKAAFRTYTQALGAGDLAALKATVISSEKINKMLEGQISYGDRERKFRVAIVKAFPSEAKSLPDPTQQTLAAIEKAEVKTEGESATLVTSLSTEPVKLRQIDGKWKLDLTAMYPEDALDDVMSFRRSLADVMEDMTPDIDAGKFKAYTDVQNNLETRVKMRMALPQEDAATRPDEPATKPSN